MCARVRPRRRLCRDERGRRVLRDRPPVELRGGGAKLGGYAARCTSPATRSPLLGFRAPVNAPVSTGLQRYPAASGGDRIVPNPLLPTRRNRHEQAASGLLAEEEGFEPSSDRS